MTPAANEYHICSTGLTPEENTGAMGLVNELGMSWDDDLHHGVTHLLAKGVGSDKYKAAVAAGMVVVKPEWLVECSQRRQIVPTVPFELGILEGLCICTTGLYLEDRELVEQLCNEHHALYQPELSFGVTTHLLAEQPGGAKYEAAIAHGIPVVTLEWIAACVEAKAFVDEDPYRVKGDDDETGVLDDVPTSMKLADELTQCIALLRDEPRGEFLDGCVFWLAGFSNDLVLKMKWLIRFGMGSRYDAYNPSVTHIIADVMGLLSVYDGTLLFPSSNWRHYGDTNGALEVVSPKWLIESCLASECLQEAQFPVAAVAPAPPKPAPVPIRPSPPVRAAPTPAASVVVPEKPKPEPPKGLFANIMSLLLRTWPVGQKPTSRVKAAISAAGGRTRELNTADPRILTAKDLQSIAFLVVCNGTVLPEGMLKSLRDSMPQAKVVTEVWVQCSLEANVLYPRRAHELFTLSTSATQSTFPTLPLACFESVVASVSLYMDLERDVLSTLLELAGAKVTARFSARNTHLVCSAPEGAKYEKAVKYNTAIVNAEWVVHSMVHGRLLPVPKALTGTPKRKRDAVPEEPARGLSQLDPFLGGDTESLGFPAPRAKVAVPTPEKSTVVNPNFFDDSQAPLPNSEMVGYADHANPRTLL
ncbi:hypothetical protein ACHHYP_06939 [Achlya hypogyna]|uniref:BRCT domain-containing protein n=1 Tax=Achlya hypogyna TaxID=1202772 RepID=A0A1V9ZMY8_ACHHY|nr:hypothetical protein ACHHYP_06939 [Achlya hypogyna]